LTLNTCLGCPGGFGFAREAAAGLLGLVFFARGCSFAIVFAIVLAMAGPPYRLR
jgi:hypothetical protein